MRHAEENDMYQVVFQESGKRPKCIGFRMCVGDVMYTSNGRLTCLSLPVTLLSQ